MDSYVTLDIEATSPNPEEAEILEIAAQDVKGRTFHRYVATSKPLKADHEAFRFTGIPFNEYEQEKIPLKKALEELLEFVGERPLLGHNLLRYDLPVLGRALSEVGLELPTTVRPALDTLRLAHLVFPTPPRELSSYRLGDLHAYLTGDVPKDAHRAQADVASTWRVLARLKEQNLPGGVSRAWRELGLVEGKLFPETQTLVKDFLSTPAFVEWVCYEGKPFPNFSHLGKDLLPQRRLAQEEMFGEVEAALRNGRRVLLEAPTGTGKTKGYLYPALRLDEKTWVATYTKVLQAQALNELKEVGEKGYSVKAALVKSPRDTLCPEALFELFLDVRVKNEEKSESKASEELRAAVAMLLHYAALGKYDLEAVPSYWHFSPGFREAREYVGTNPRRCRESCDFFSTCAYQRQLSHRKAAQILVTNQAYLLTHFLREEVGEEPSHLVGDSRRPKESPEEEQKKSQEKVHLVLDEGHHIEDIATEALTLVLDHEALIHQINRLAHPQEDRGLLKDQRRLDEVSEEERNKAKELIRSLLPSLQKTLDDYSHHLVTFIKNRGSGDPRYGLNLGLSSAWKRLEEWPRINREEESLIHLLRELKAALGIIGRNPQTLMARDLVPIREYIEEALNLLLERRQVLGLAAGTPNPNLLHLSEWDPITNSWQHLAQPIDVSQALEERLWPRFRSIVLTSATLSTPTDRDYEEGEEGFEFIKRVLGLKKAEHRRLPPPLPYEKAHLLVPRHLPEARESTLPRFQRMLHEELKVLLPQSHRSLSLFTSLRRLQEAKEALEEVPNLLAPLTRKEREDVASLIKQDPKAPVAALGSRSYMEGVDFPALKLVNLERIPFPPPSLLLTKRMERAHAQGLDKWWDYYLPKAALSFAQAFGRLIRDQREEVGDGAFILWDKKLLNAAYQGVFYRALPRGVQQHFPESRKELYDQLADILEVDRGQLPQEELEEEALYRLKEILQSDLDAPEKARRIAEEIYGLVVDQARWSKQIQAIQGALEGRDLIALLPTGFGKSLAFQLPAFMEQGLTLVVSPLVALMKDQADRLLELGLPVGAVHSLMGSGEQRSVLDEARAGRVQLLYVSPERLNRSEALWKLIQDKYNCGQLRRVVFDEAHCLVEWGFDFRPDYLKALRKMEALEGVPRSFFTATLTPEDLGRLKGVAKMGKPLEIRPESFHRSNLRFVVKKAHGNIGKFEVLTKALLWLMSFREGGSAIIYTATRAEAERLAWALGTLFPNLEVEAYHAGMGPVPRREAQERFISGITRVMVATTAFGMGIDKADIRLVVHWQPPRSLEEYIQQSGRAGRDGKEAYCLLLHTQSDWSFLRWAIGVGKASEVQANFVCRLLELLKKEGLLIGYREELYRRIYASPPGYEGEEDGIEKTSLEESDEEEDAGEPSVIFQQEIGLENFERTLASLERAGVLEYEYLLGRALLQEPEATLSKQLDKKEMDFLRKINYKNSQRGDRLDFSKISPEEAQDLDRRIYKLFRERKIGLYHYQESLLRIRAGKQLETGYSQWNEERQRLAEYAQKRLERVRSYAENERCRTQVLLKHLGETLTACDTCDTCAKDKGPWEALEAPGTSELERAYRPLDTLLAFFAWTEENSRSQGTRYAYLGKRSTLMALRGKDRTKNGLLPRKYTDNPLFGRLPFIKSGELERVFEEALKQGYIESKGDYEGSKLYGLTDKGRDRYRRWLRWERKRGET